MKNNSCAERMSLYSFGLFATFAFVIASLSGAVAFAQEGGAIAPAAPAPVSAVNGADTAWMLLATGLVMLMTPGLALFYGGMVRVKNVVATLMQSFVALAVVSMLWYAVGYSLAFGPSVDGLIGRLDFAFLKGVGGTPNAGYAATIPHSLFMAFQLMFAIITPALISGAIAERMKFSAYLLFISIWSLVVYAPVAHWVWGVGGFMRNWGILDFAGGLVVHQTAGFSALAAAWVLGRRKGVSHESASPASIPLVLIGTALLWFGWFGFNGGSALASGELAASAMIVTHFAAAAAAAAWIILDWLRVGKPSLVGACIAAVVGLVAITPASGFVGIGPAILIGIVSAVISNLACVVMKAYGRVDDSLDVFACHGLGGLCGALLTGLFAEKAINSAGVDGSLAQFIIQLQGSALVGVYSIVVTIVLLKILDLIVGLRPTEAAEVQGMDVTEHGERAYTI